MRAEHKFLRVRDGIAAFARVAVDSTPADEWSVTLGGAAATAADAYARALHSGVALAVAQQEALQGARHRVVVVEFVGPSLVDERFDATECAAAIAAWTSFGNREEDIAVLSTDGRWTVSWQR
jgi:hypothetical protein